MGAAIERAEDDTIMLLLGTVAALYGASSRVFNQVNSFSEHKTLNQYWQVMKQKHASNFPGSASH